jgi:general stress protein YciG
MTTMSGTRIGGLKALQTNKTKYGLDFYQSIGRKGGKRGTGHKFAHGRVDPGVVGRIGGSRTKDQYRTYYGNGLL